MRDPMRLALLFCLSASLLSAESRLLSVLEGGQTAFGTFVRDKTPEEARAFGNEPRLDFLFYDMERGEFDVDRLRGFLQALRSAPHPHTVIVRIPPIHGDPAGAKARTEALIAAGADGVAFPHVMSAKEAADAVSWIEAATDRMWPGNPDGDFVSFVMIEDPDVVPHSEEVARTRGVSIVSPGPGSLRGAYDGDMNKVQAAVETVLAACHAAGVPCANTASPADVEEKVARGFKVLIALGDEALELGRSAAKR